MNTRKSIWVIALAVSAYALWELAGHWLVMGAPMAARHVISATVGVLLALVVALIAVQTVLRQYKELTKLARLRDYLLKMEAHYLRLSPTAPVDPLQHFESQALNNRFVDLQHLAASVEPVVRAQAMCGMADFAETVWPGRPKLHTAENFPFYGRAVSHLAAELYLERDEAVRSEAAGGIARLVKFGAQPPQALLHLLIDELAHANRTAWQGYLASLQRYCLISGLPLKQCIERAVQLSSPWDGNPAAILVIDELMHDPRFQPADVGAGPNVVSGQPSDPVSAASVERDLIAAAEMVTATREALAGALSGLRSPIDLPKDETDRRYWHRESPLTLGDCFLAGMKLTNACLEGADLRRARIEGAILTGARLVRADLSGAHLERSQITGANLYHAKLREALLEEASLTSSDLRYADLSESNLEGCQLIGTKLDGARLWRVSVEAPGPEPKLKANFTNANWWDARYSDDLSGTTDKSVSGWLEVLFPQAKDSADRNAA